MHAGRVWIVKPGSRNRGKGIEVFDSIRDIERHLAAQRCAGPPVVSLRPLSTRAELGLLAPPCKIHISDDNNVGLRQLHVLSLRAWKRFPALPALMAPLRVACKHSMLPRQAAHDLSRAQILLPTCVARHAGAPVWPQARLAVGGAEVHRAAAAAGRAQV